MATTKTRYVYSTVRVVPHPSAAEFINVAVIVGSDTTGEWQLHQAGDESRIRRFCGAGALTAAHDFMNHIGDELDLATLSQEDDLFDVTPPAPSVDEAWLARLSRSMMHVVQVSQPRPLLAPSIAAALSLVLPRVLPLPDGPTSRGVTRKTLISSLARSFAAHQVPTENLLRRPVLTTGGAQPFSAVADFALLERSVLQITQAWSFRIEDQHMISQSAKAWGWSMKSLRESGASLRGLTGVWSVPQDVDIQVVCVPPDEGAPTDVLHEARAIFREVGAHYIELDADLAAGRSKELLERAR